MHVMHDAPQPSVNGWVWVPGPSHLNHVLAHHKPLISALTDGALGS